MACGSVDRQAVRQFPTFLNQGSQVPAVGIGGEHSTSGKIQEEQLAAPFGPTPGSAQLRRDIAHEKVLSHLDASTIKTLIYPRGGLRAWTIETCFGGIRPALESERLINSAHRFAATRAINVRRPIQTFTSTGVWRRETARPDSCATRPAGTTHRSVHSYCAISDSGPRRHVNARAE